MDAASSAGDPPAGDAASSAGDPPAGDAASSAGDPPAGDAASGAADPPAMDAASSGADPPPPAVDEEIRRRLRAQRMRGDFAAVHAAPTGAGDVPDQAGARLVLLGPEHPHRATGSPALEHAAALVDEAGDGAPRAYRNMLVFLAADAERLDQLRTAVARWLAAPSGEQERTVAAQLGETWRWLLAPSGGGWTATSAAGRDDLAMRASRELRADGRLFVDYPPARLRADLDRVPLWPAGGDHVPLGEVWEAYARSLDLPRLRSSAVLAAAVVGGTASAERASETFAYAEAWDAERGRFAGLVVGHGGSLALKGSGLLVRAEAAAAQLAGEAPER